MELLKGLIKGVGALGSADGKEDDYEAKFTALETELTNNAIYTQAQNGLSS